MSNYDVFGIVLAVMMLVLGYLIFKEVQKVIEAKKVIKSYKKEQESLAEKKVVADNKVEMNRIREIRETIIKTVDSFLKSAKFINAVAIRNEEKIYQYIYSDGQLYEFKKFLLENDRSIGIDAVQLCFRGLEYERVTLVRPFMEKFTSEIDLTPDGNPNIASRGLGMSLESRDGKDVVKTEMPLKVV